MGYRGKVAEQERARELRAEAWALVEIANELGVSKSSVSLWVRDVEEAVYFWADLTEIPPSQFSKPYRAVADSLDPPIEAPDGLLDRLLRVFADPSRRDGARTRAARVSTRPSGVAQLAERSAVNRIVVGSSPTPGAS
jgi:transcriptional regulator with XRE-family HTH domain